MGGQHQGLAALSPRKDLVLLAQEVGWASRPVWKGMAKLAHHWEKIPRQFKPTARHYTDYVTLATNCCCSNITNYLTSYHNNYKLPTHFVDECPLFSLSSSDDNSWSDPPEYQLSSELTVRWDWSSRRWETPDPELPTICPTTLLDSSQDPDCIRGSSEITASNVHHSTIMPTGYMNISPLILNSIQFLPSR